MRRVLHWLMAFVCFSACAAGISYAFGAETLKFMTGQTLKHNLSVCLAKEDAIAIFDAEVRGGFEAASAVWESKRDCMNTDVVGPTVGKVVHSAQITRGEQKLTGHVVEILNNGDVIGYFLTSGKVEAKRDRDA